MALRHLDDLSDPSASAEVGERGHGLLQRATSAMRAEPPDHHLDISAMVRERIGGLVPSGREFVVHAQGGVATHDGSGSRVSVAERVVRAAVRRAATTGVIAPDRLRVVVEDATSPTGERTQHVELRLDVVARYGTDLRRAADDLRGVLLGLLDATLGPVARPRVIDLNIVDVMPHDPTHGWAIEQDAGR